MPHSQATGLPVARLTSERLAMLLSFRQRKKNKDEGHQCVGEKGVGKVKQPY